MAQASKTFRIFVSSTFSDLKAERNALQEHVFPKLRELCAMHGCRFQAIDLRWGIGDEAALDQQTMKICQEEIARCQRVTPRPNFVVLLGDRYGWQPLPSEIPVPEFEEIQQQVELLGRRIDRFERDGDDRDLLNHWYKRDDNAAPPVYWLQPRDGAYERNEVWASVEQRLHTVLFEAAERIALLDDEQLRYIASATEQEIVNGALTVSDAREHVFCFFRRITNFEVLPLRGGSAQEFIDVTDNGQLDGRSRQFLLRLKERLRRALGKNVHEYQAEWRDAGLTTAHIGSLPRTLEQCLKLSKDTRRAPSLCGDVWRRLSRVILDEIARLKELDRVETEVAEHEEFGRERARHFVGRADDLRTIDDYVTGAGDKPLVLFGASGAGKSALMARAADHAHRQHPRAEMIARFIGATSASSSGRDLLEGLCRQVSRRYGVSEDGVPSDYTELAKELSKRFSLATAAKPLIVFLDALDQLSDADHARNLSWLPETLPGHVRLIVSTLPGECLSALKNKLPPRNVIEVKQMPSAEAGELLDRWLKDCGRRLQSAQRAEVLAKFERCGLPLYLKLAFEETKRWRSYDRVPSLEVDIPGLINRLFKRLSEDSNHGEVMVARSLGYLVAAKNGLVEDELIDVLSRDKEMMAEFKRRSPRSPDVDRLPTVVWSRLFFDLEPYLTERIADGTSLLSFYHRQLNESAVRNYLSGNAGRERHRSLSEYFREQELRTEREGGLTWNLRRMSELPYQQMRGELWEELELTLCDLEFVEAKCSAGRIYDLAADYSASLSAKGFRRDEHPQIEEFARFVRSQGRLFAARPNLVFQQAANEPETTGPSRAATRRWGQGLVEQPWLRWLNKPERGTLHLMKLSGHTRRITSFGFSPDGSRVLSASDDGTLKLWDAATGEELATMRQEEYFGRSIWAFSPDGMRIIAANSVGVVRIWDCIGGAELSSVAGKWSQVLSCGFTDGEGRFITPSRPLGWSLQVREAGTGKSLFKLRGFGRRIRDCAFSKDGASIISYSGSKPRIWNAKTGEILRLSGQREKEEADTPTSGVARAEDLTLSPDGKRELEVSPSDDTTLLVWDAKRRKKGRGRQKAQGFNEHDSEVTACAFSPDGKRLFSTWMSGDLALWDSETGQKMATAKLPYGSIYDGAFSLDGGRILTATGLDLVFWDGITGHKERKGEIQIEKGVRYITCAFSPDGLRIVAKSDSNTLTVWDAERRTKIVDLIGHKKSVNACAFSPDGAWIVTGSADKTLKLWNLATGRELATLRGHEYGVQDCIFSMDGSIVLSSAADCSRVWEFSSGKQISDFKHRFHALSPDGEAVLVSVFDDGRTGLEIVDPTTGQSIRRLAEHPGEIGYATFSPDARWIAFAVNTHFGASVRSEALKVCDAKTGQLICDYPIGVERLKCSPDGKYLALTSRGTVHLLQLENLKPGPLIVTAWFSPSDGDCAFGCPACRQWSQVSTSDVGSEISCPRCGASLSLNPFVIRSHWERVAEAWREEGNKNQTAAVGTKRKRARRVIP